jgi:hypothetical protein
MRLRAKAHKWRPNIKIVLDISQPAQEARTHQ